MPKHSNSLEKDKRAVAVFIELKETTESLEKKMNQKGWGQRNALITHVNSNFNNHEELVEKRDKWEETVLQFNVHNILLKLVAEYRDLFGYFPEYKEMMTEFQELINAAVAKEEFEIAIILKKWKDKFPTP